MALLPGTELLKQKHPAEMHGAFSMPILGGKYGSKARLQERIQRIPQQA